MITAEEIHGRRDRTMKRTASMGVSCRWNYCHNFLILLLKLGLIWNAFCLTFCLVLAGSLSNEQFGDIDERYPTARTGKIPLLPLPSIPPMQQQEGGRVPSRYLGQRMSGPGFIRARAPMIGPGPGTRGYSRGSWRFPRLDTFLFVMLLLKFMLKLKIMVANFPPRANQILIHMLFAEATDQTPSLFLWLILSY